MATQAQIAGHLGVSPGRVSQMVKAGMPTGTIEDAERWRAANRQRAPAIKATAPRAVDAAAAPATEASDWRARLERAKALSAEQELERSAGRLLDADLVQTTWEKRIAAARSRILAAPRGVLTRFVTPAKVEAAERALNDALYEALAELSGVVGD
jgi:hypothetical protein